MVIRENRAEMPLFRVFLFGVAHSTILASNVVKIKIRIK